MERYKDPLQSDPYLLLTVQIEMVGEETFGKSGCRRVVPGQFLATDPKGRAVMVAALEKQKIVYVITRDPDAGIPDNMLILHASQVLLR